MKKAGTVSYDRPFNLPSLREIFGSNHRLMKTLSEAGFKTVTPLMLLPLGSLQTVREIGPRSDASITKLLAHNGLERRKYYEKLPAFMSNLYGTIENAPVGALHVAVVRRQAVNYPTYAPLEAITLFEEFEPHMTIGDLVKMGRRQLQYVLGSSDGDELPVHSPEDDLMSIEARLAYLQSGLTVAAPLPLRAVS